MYDYTFRLDDQERMDERIAAACRNSNGGNGLGPGDRYLPQIVLQNDQEIAESEPCPECGGPMHYRPWYDLSIRKYVAEAVCSRCKHTISF